MKISILKLLNFFFTIYHCFDYKHFCSSSINKINEIENLIKNNEIFIDKTSVKLYKQNGYIYKHFLLKKPKQYNFDWSEILSTEINKVSNELSMNIIFSNNYDLSNALENGCYLLNKSNLYFKMYDYGPTLLEYQQYLIQQKWSMNKFLIHLYDIFTKLAKSIKKLHINNIGHFDIRMNNVIIYKSFIPVLVDFGMSQKFKNKLRASKGYFFKRSNTQFIINDQPDVYAFGQTIKAFGQSLYDFLESNDNNENLKNAVNFFNNQCFELFEQLEIDEDINKELFINERGSIDEIILFFIKQQLFLFQLDYRTIKKEYDEYLQAEINMIQDDSSEFISKYRLKILEDIEKFNQLFEQYINKDNISDGGTSDDGTSDDADSSDDSNDDSNVDTNNDNDLLQEKENLQKLTGEQKTQIDDQTTFQEDKLELNEDQDEENELDIDTINEFEIIVNQFDEYFETIQDDLKNYIKQQFFDKIDLIQNLNKINKYLNGYFIKNWNQQYSIEQSSSVEIQNENTQKFTNKIQKKNLVTKKHLNKYDYQKVDNKDQKQNKKYLSNKNIHDFQKINDEFSEDFTTSTQISIPTSNYDLQKKIKNIESKLTEKSTLKLLDDSSDEYSQSLVDLESKDIYLQDMSEEVRLQNHF